MIFVYRMTSSRILTEKFQHCKDSIKFKWEMYVSDQVSNDSLSSIQKFGEEQ